MILYATVFPDYEEFETVGSIWETIEEAEAAFDYRNDLYILKCHTGQLYNGNALVGDRTHRLSFDDATDGFYRLRSAYMYSDVVGGEFIDYLLNNGCIINTPDDVLAEAIKLFQEWDGE